MNTREQDICHAPLSNNFLIPQNFASASECDITFQWYHNFIMNHITFLLGYLICEQQNNINTYTHYVTDQN